MATEHTSAGDIALSTAERRLPLLTISAAVALAVAGLAPAAAAIWPNAEVRTFLGLIGSIAASTGGAVLALRLVEGARSRVAAALDIRTQAVSSQSDSKPTAAIGLLTGAGTDHDLRVAGETRRLGLIATWGQAAVMFPLAVLAVAVPWWLRPVSASANDGELSVAIVAVIIAFPLLIIERRLHTIAPERLREARPLARLLRLGVWTLVVGGAATACRALDIEFAAYGQWAVLGLVTAVAAELALRALATPFLPVTRAVEARALGDSALTALLLTRGEGTAFGHGLKERFGIDLTQSWAMRFLKRAALPLGGVLLVIAWLVSGLTTLGTGERGVYERFGAPQSVLQPGLHAHLPWPFGRVRRVEFGQVHEQPLVEAITTADVDQTLDPLAAVALTPDVDTPASFDRLWDKRHGSDATYLVPGASTSGTSVGLGRATVGYQLLNSDVRVLWRVGLSDDAARDAVYQVVAADTLVRSEAMRLLQRTFATRSLAGLIGEDRDLLTTDLRTSLQSRLDGFRAGIDITAVVIDAIHPPRAAVPAYHGVQAAEIGAKTDIARAKGQAAAVLADAQRDAIERLAKGTAIATEATAGARADVVRFSADRAAFDAAPTALRLERWLQAIGRSLKQAQVTVVDHRLPIDGGPLIDLRRNAPGNE